MPEKKLHVFEMTEGPDTVIAESIEDAWKVWSKTTGQSKDEYQADYENDEFEQVPDDKMMKIFMDDEGKISDSGNQAEMTAAEWVKREGSGWLCSTEF